MWLQRGSNPEAVGTGWPGVRALAVNWTEYFGGAAGAPWVWWVAALVVLVVLLVLLMRLLGLLPE